MNLIADTSSEERKRLETEITNNDQFKNDLASALTHEQMMTVLGPGYINASAKLKLETAMDGWNADEQQVYSIIQNAPNAESQAILDDDQLMTKLKNTLSTDTMIAAMGELNAHAKRKLKVAMDGWGTDVQEIRNIAQSAPQNERNQILNDTSFLRNYLKSELAWNPFAKVLELLGRQTPTQNDLQNNGTVTGALNTAWNASNPGNPNRGANPQEQGGWIYLDIITDTINIRHHPGGEQASIDLNDPPILSDSIVVGHFHTHPNITPGPTWPAHDSPADQRWGASTGVPGLARAVHNQIFTFGPNRRAHLAGPKGLPGPSGGIPPQVKLDEEGNIIEDDV
jgi:hypothetical protein